MRQKNNTLSQKQFFTMLVCCIFLSMGLSACGYTVIQSTASTQQHPQISDSLLKSLYQLPKIHYSMPEQRPTNFGFIFHFDSRNVLDTYDHTFTKDMVCGKDITVNFYLTQTQLDTIYTMMNTIDLFNYPTFVEDPCPRKGFPNNITFDIHADTVQRSIHFHKYSYTCSERVKKVSRLENYIESLIYNSEIYKKLPPPPCMRL